MLIRAKLLAGSTVTVEVEQSTTIKEIKEEVRRKKEIPTNLNIELVVGGKKLIDELTVGYYKLGALSTVHVVPMPQGMCIRFS